MTVKGVGGSKAHPPVVHPQNVKTERPAPPPPKTSSHPSTPPNPVRPKVNESSSSLVASRQGLDSSRLLRARLEAQFAPTAATRVAQPQQVSHAPKASIATNKTSRAAKSDPLNQRLPTNGDPDRRRSVNPDRNRAVNPDRRKIGSHGKLTNKSFRFPIEKGTRLVDGRLKDRGEIKAGSVKLNYGQQKRMNGQDYVYAFDTRIEKNGKTGHVSGWILKSSLKGDLENRVNTVVNAKKPAGDHGPYRQYSITGGNRKEFGDLKVVPNSHKRNERASDYLNRHGAVNLLYNLPRKGGVSTDTLPRGATFHRSNAAQPRSVKLYKPDSSEPVKKKMTFVYGFVTDPQTNQRRYGWIAAASLGKQHKA